jgi:hypothetical protein
VPQFSGIYTYAWILCTYVYLYTYMNVHTYKDFDTIYR